ncbi:MAG: type VI secretion system baseplate subunit TssG [Candidatus Cloacimonetes bacterium]|nr:type VI secretion system baseplate subunit TssG [Candidatus Cloacimonadota bacterium]
MAESILKQQDLHAVIEQIKKITGCNTENVWKKIRIRPEASFRFPRQDISSIKYNSKKDRYEIEVTFLGLYGVSSPLPAHYTTDLLEEYGDEIEENCIVRDFLDLLNEVIYKKYYLIDHKKYLGLRYWADKSNKIKNVFKSLSGDFSESSDEESLKLDLLEYYAQKTRSKYNLERMLTTLLNKEEISVHENMETIYKISNTELNRLGRENNVAGNNIYLGSKKRINSSKIAIEIIISNLEEMREYFSNKKELIEMELNTYLGDIIEFEIFLLVSGKIMEKTLIGVTGHQLSINSILGKATNLDNYKIKLYDSELMRS